MAKSVAKMLGEFSDTHHFLDSMSEEQKGRLIAISSVRRLSHQQQVATLGEPVDGIFLIIEGSLRLESFSEDGERFLAGDFLAGDMFGFLAVLDGKPSVHDATALGETTVIFINGERFRQFVFTDTELTKRAVEILCQRLRMSLAMVTRFAPGNQTSRVVRCLVASADQLGFRPHAGHQIRITINQFDLAAMLSISRQSVHRVLKELEDDGLLSIGYGVINVHDLNRLRALQ
ncbi:Crp/Fnr family transcriptional regulator [Sedimentitalea sp. XS_ASV28]|uniref:Crp/Fnr family transcriptional regulator n=1 Tax=Sedimentitalea sp. XS_ASV28 TaxID=3241296 RepID=UPI00351832FF